MDMCVFVMRGTACGHVGEGSDSPTICERITPEGALQVSAVAMVVLRDAVGLVEVDGDRENTRLLRGRRVIRGKEHEGLVPREERQRSD